MSHVATVDVEIKDLDSLGAACERLGLRLALDKKKFHWFGQHVGDYPLPPGFTAEDMGKCDHCIYDLDNPHGYQIGVVKRRDGRAGYLLMWDFWNDGAGSNTLATKAGAGLNGLRQSYATAVATKAARRNGFRVQETKLANGQIQLMLSK